MYFFLVHILALKTHDLVISSSLSRIAAASAVHHESTAVFDSTWIVKNNDSIPDALEDVLLASSSNFVQSLSTLHLQAGLAGASDTVPSATTATGTVCRLTTEPLADDY